MPRPRRPILATVYALLLLVTAGLWIGSAFISAYMDYEPRPTVGWRVGLWPGQLMIARVEHGGRWPKWTFDHGAYPDDMRLDWRWKPEFWNTGTGPALWVPFWLPVSAFVAVLWWSW